MLMKRDKRKRPVGRPKKTEGKAHNRTVRVTDEDWQLWHEASYVQEESLSAWMRQVLNRAAKRLLAKRP